MDWSGSNEAFDQHLVSPNEDNRKCMSWCEENLDVFQNERFNSTRGPNTNSNSSSFAKILPLFCFWEIQQASQCD